MMFKKGKYAIIKAKKLHIKGFNRYNYSANFRFYWRQYW